MKRPQNFVIIMMRQKQKLSYEFYLMRWWVQYNTYPFSHSTALNNEGLTKIGGAKKIYIQNQQKAIKQIKRFATDI